MKFDFVLDKYCKGFAPHRAPLQVSELGVLEFNVLNDSFAYPLAVVCESALQHNLQWMQAYAKRKGVQLAPHGKTSLSPQLLERQLAMGAWGLTFATVHQAQIGVAAGAQRILIANQVLSKVDLLALSQLLRESSGLRVWFLVDSHAQLQLIEDWHSQQPGLAPFDVLLEIGIPGQRTGCRNQVQAMGLARSIKASPAVRLCGVECYEGGSAKGVSAHDVPAVDGLIRRVLECVHACEQEALFEDSELLLTAGGSAVFDLVLPLLRAQGLQHAVLGVLRSGCYVTHDHGHYARFLKLVEQREGLSTSLRPALYVWTMVQSVPEPGLALLSCGRRDISYDIELPQPVYFAPRGAHQAEAAPKAWSISGLNDHHAYLRFDPEATAPQVGDRVALGISHPCTTFDKWRWLALVDDAWFVQGALQTHF